MITRNSLEVKQATVDHLDEVASLFNEYRMFYEQESDLEGAKRYLSERYENEESIIFIAIDISNGDIIGFTQLYPSFSSISMKRSWILNDLYIGEEYRRRGAAKLLLDAAREHAERTNAKGLGLSTAMTNHNAQRLYEMIGYKKDTDFYHYYLSI